MDYQGFFQGGCLFLHVSLDRTGELTWTLQERRHKQPVRPQKALNGATEIYAGAAAPVESSWSFVLLSKRLLVKMLNRSPPFIEPLST